MASQASLAKTDNPNIRNNLLHFATKSGRNPPHIKHGGL